MSRRPAPTSLLLVVITVMLGVLLAVMDAAIVNVAIPTIAGNLGATPDVAAWVATGYTLGMMIVMPLNGWLTLRLGQKNYYIAALGLFTLMSLMCAPMPRESRPSFSVNDAELMAVSAAGFTEEVIVEIVSNVGLQLLTGYAALCADLPPDDDPIVPLVYRQ